MNKICSPEQLRNTLSNSKKIVLCHGVFDIVHLGHIQYLQEAKKYGDVLVVSITADEYVHKGPNQPYFNTQQRAEFLSSIECIDYIVISNESSAVSIINEIQPNYYARGVEYQNRHTSITSKLVKEKEAIEKHNGKLLFVSGKEIFSSSSLLHKQLYSKETVQFLEDFKCKYDIEKIIKYFDKISQLEINLIGEIIIDEYIYVSPLGKSSKYPTLTVQYESATQYNGGIFAVAKLLSSFVKRINVISNINSLSTQILQQSPNNIIYNSIIENNSSQKIIKQRYIESYYKQRLFEVYKYNPRIFDKCDILTKVKNKNIPTLIVDYGHGLIKSTETQKLKNNIDWLGINVQCNAGNYGFNLIDKYPSVDFVVVDENELRLNYRDKYTTIKNLLNKTINICSCVTLGSHGSLLKYKDKIYKCPAFSNNVIDTIGAGDSFFAITSTLKYVDAPPEIINFVGNVIGALVVSIMGHSQMVTKIKLLKAIQSLLK